MGVPRRFAGLAFPRCMLCVFTVVALLVVGAPCSAATAAPVPTEAPLNPEFLDYLDGLKAGRAPQPTQEAGCLGYIPPPVDLSHLRGQRLFDDRAAIAPPAFFDLRLLGRLQIIRNQFACGACWAFGAYGSLESCVLSLSSETWDFSENNLKNTHGFDYGHCEGGTRDMVTAYLARLGGPVTEADDPYNPSSDVSPPYLPVQKHVQEVWYLPDRAGPLDNDNIKQAVMSYGAVSTTIYWDDSYYDSDNYTYYCPDTFTVDHAPSIVGWDDNFDKTLFPTEPPGDGAFIMRNTWGDTFGEDGYFYISYYDVQVGMYNFVFPHTQPFSPKTICHQYDPLGWVISTGYSSETAWFANVFSVDRDQVLAATAFYTAAVDSTYELYIYLDPTSGPITGGTLLCSNSGTIVDPGYHTIPLDTGVFLSSGHTFSVVVTLTTPGYIYPIATERVLAGYSSGATANAGESFISSNGISWTDTTVLHSNRNVCLKAFAVPAHLLSLLEVHPNERGPGPTAVNRFPGLDYWTWPALVSGSAYTWKQYDFAGSGDLWIQVCAQNFSAYQNSQNASLAQEDLLKLTIDGIVPSDVWGIQSGGPGGYQWKGSAEAGNRVTLEFLVTGLTPGLHQLVLDAQMSPAIYWVKVHDLEGGYELVPAQVWSAGL